MSLLSKEEQRTVNRYGSTEPQTFEDHARVIGESDDPRAAEVKEALANFQSAVNAVWVYAMEAGIIEGLAGEWHRKMRAYHWLDRADVYAEAVMAMRYFVVRFHAGNGRLYSYAKRGLHQQLTEWAGQQGPMQVPRDFSRKHTQGGLVEADVLEGSYESSQDDEDRLRVKVPELSVDYEKVMNTAMDADKEEGR